MAIEKRTVVDQIEATRNGTVQVRFGLVLVENGAEIDCKWHRTAIEPGGSVDAQIAAVNVDLARSKYPAITPSDIDRIKAIAQVAQTPSVISAFKASVAAAIAR
jgi:hypothetical protein